MTLRIYLTGNVCIESDTTLVREDRFAGMQGRVVFAMLAAEHGRPVSRGELVEELWGGAPPASWDAALRSVVSKLRGLLSEAGLGGGALASAFGSYQLHLPTGSWVDVEAAADAIHRAEPAMRDGNLADAVGFGRVAATVSARPLLAGAAGPWVERRRAQLRDIRLRALHCLADAWLAVGDAGTAARDAELAIELDPFHEPSHRLLMRALVQSGNRAGALVAYERCRRLLVEELGADPSSETEAVHLEILRGA
ncbi:MAG TPA: BTAD domain-containing putative transcriptional regulator [Actinomycetota bacterium]|jgi:DNA-binding SARP family transcriptional activator|nr:BTAD domain-containing putative transcriptional regulator [Actinomycetota bacterium]